MLKKILVGTAALAVVSGLVLGREWRSYLWTGAHSFRQAVKAEVPVEFEIQRARALVEQLIPDIRHCMHVIAEQQVDVEQMQKQIARKETDLAKQKETLLAMRKDVGTGRAVLIYAGRSYTVEAVQRDLSTRFERYKAAEELLAADTKILAAREQNLQANQEKLAGMLQARKDLEVKLEQLVARLETLRAAETVSTLAIDDSNLSHARQLIDDLNKQLDVKQKVLDAEGKFAGLIPMESVSDAPVPADIMAKIDAHFEPGPVSAETAIVTQ